MILFAPPIKKPELGIKFLMTMGTPEDAGNYTYVRIEAPNYGSSVLAENQHSLAIIHDQARFKLKTGPSLIDLVITGLSCVRLDLMKSPHLASLSTSTRTSTSIPGKLRSLVAIEVFKTFCDFSPRHVRLVRVFSIPRYRLGIKPAACLEVLIMSDSIAPTYSTSSPYRLLGIYDQYGLGYNCVPYARKNRKPVITIRDRCTRRHEPSCIIMDDYLIEEKTIAPQIIPPFRGAKNREEYYGGKLGFHRNLSHRDIFTPVYDIFCK